MEVKCIADTGEAYRGKKMPVGYSEKTYFGGVRVGEEYTVVGMTLVDDILHYIVDEGTPVNYPYMLFEIIDSRLPPMWHFNKIDLPATEISAVWGYYELCFDPDHYDALFDSERNACTLYYQRKKEIEDSLSNDIDL